MFTTDGKNLISLVLVGKEQHAASHIAMGLNKVYGNTTGVAGGVDNFYHSPYIVEEIPLTQATIVGSYITYAGQAAVSTRYIADNMGLVLVRPKGNSRTHKTLINVSNDSQWANVKRLNAPETTFTVDGILGTDYTNTTLPTYTGAVPLSGYGVEDIIAVPVLFAHQPATANPFTYTTNVPTGDTLKINFNYLEGGVAKTWTLSDVVQYNGTTTTYHFQYGDTQGGTIVPKYAPLWTSGTDTWNDGFETSSMAHVFQRPLSSGASTLGSATALGLINNYKNITSVTFEWVRSGVGKAYTGSTLLFGSMKITPNYSSNTTRTTVAYRRLIDGSNNPRQSQKSRHESFVNAEYRLYQMVEG